MERVNSNVGRNGSKEPGMSEAARPSTLNRSVIIIGQGSLQNKLLADLIRDRTGRACLLRSDVGLSDLPIAADALALVDIESVAADDIVLHLESLAADASCRSIAIINADESTTFWQVVAWPGVKGVFFRESSHENLLKGIQGIFDGEYWLPRKMLSAHLEEIRMRQRPPVPEAAALTPKEIATLRLLAKGSSNSHVARELGVSLHTVKTHVYNVYRKLRVSNRVQAVHWALQNIDGVQWQFK
jgi:DNA-binding NarL/FixJ family response regulator